MREEKGMQGGCSFLELLLNILVLSSVVLAGMFLDASHCPLPGGGMWCLGSSTGVSGDQSPHFQSWLASRVSLLMGSLIFPG